MKKLCTVCGIEKDRSEFHIRRKSLDGLARQCKDCKRAEGSAYYIKNKNIIKNRSKDWAIQNPDRRWEISKKYRQANQLRHNLATRNYRARKAGANDGWNSTVDWWEVLLARFEYRCAYCRRKVKMTMDHVIPLARGGKHIPDNIVPACESCNYRKRDRLIDELGWTCFVPSVNDIRTEARALMQCRPGLCYQRAIREVFLRREGVPDGAPTTMTNAVVTSVTNEQAAEIIHKYEWLGTMGRPQACYGLWLPVNGVLTLAGVVCFGFATGHRAGAVCGVEYVTRAIALERGACVHWAPKNAASWLVSRACKLAAKDHGWHIFYAYSDPEAGEIGTVYQACNWIYLGIGPGHGPTRERWTTPDGVQVTSRTLRSRRLTTLEALSQGWRKEIVSARGKYVWFEASPQMKKLFRKKLVHPVHPYPKRQG